MKISDYIVRFLEEKGINDIFGIPGVGCGHFLDSVTRSDIHNHLVYHEQAAAFAVCAYSQAAHKAGFAYTTAGPGGTNLITGIANAYCDSIPAVFMVGEKDLKSLKGSYRVRQKASQEVDIVEVAAPITKWSHQVARAEDIRHDFEKAFYIAESGRPGPVLLDVPSDIARADLDIESLAGFEKPIREDMEAEARLIAAELEKSEKPLFLVGNGVKQAALDDTLLSMAEKCNVPIVTTLPCFDLFTGERRNLGYIGMDGDICANRAVRACDLLITFGARLNFKQVTENRIGFAPNARVIRIDCDEGELEYGLRDEVKICADLRDFIPMLEKVIKEKDGAEDVWLEECCSFAETGRRKGSLNPDGDILMKAFCDKIPEDLAITVDTGSHRRWVMSQFVFKQGQRLYQSSGLATMGYALPAAIGAYYGTKKPVVCIDGDGGIMMNLQELQFLRREQLPITVIVFNNRCLGDIMEFQKRIFKGNYQATTEESGYQAADFRGIAKAFHLDYELVQSPEDMEKLHLDWKRPALIEVAVPSNT